MKNEGKKFEEDFIKSLPKEVFVYRLRDSAGAWGSGGGNKTRFTASNICDFIAYSPYTHKMLLMELKSTASASLPISNIKAGQLSGLEQASHYEGVEPLFIVNFRKSSTTYAIKASKVVDFITNTERKSVPYSFFQEEGILLPQTLKKVRYSYDTMAILQ